MRARLPDFVVYSGICRLLLAEFKFAQFTLHDIRPEVWGESGALRSTLNGLLTVMWDAHNNDGYDVPWRFSKDASHIVQHHTQRVESSTQVLPTNECPEPKRSHLGAQFATRRSRTVHTKGFKPISRFFM